MNFKVLFVVVSQSWILNFCKNHEFLKVWKQDDISGILYNETVFSGILPCFQAWEFL
jgi:hypothetical protein